VDYLCNGSNDAAQINAAIAALGSRGGTIRLLEGYYYINDTIRLNKNYITIEGMGRESTTILKSASVVGIEITAMDAKLKDLSLYGNGYSGNGINIVGSGKTSNIYTILENVKSDNHVGSHGLLINSCARVRVICCFFAGNGNCGIYLDNASGHTIEGCIVMNNAGGNVQQQIRLYYSSALIYNHTGNIYCYSGGSYTKYTTVTV
jgi:parallel beta-helix repeat protein